MSAVFAHGQLRLYLLALLADGPRHGYDLIRDLEATFNGLYAPSAGTVYPRLAKLEEEGLIERLDEGRKSPYRITAAGRAEIDARRGEIEDIRRDIAHSVSDLAETVRSQVHEQTTNLREELRAAAKAARAGATTVNSGRAAYGTAAYGELDRVINDFRHQSRSAWRTVSLSAGQVREISAILRQAAERIHEVVSR